MERRERPTDVTVSGDKLQGQLNSETSADNGRGSQSQATVARSGVDSASRGIDSASYVASCRPLTSPKCPQTLMQ